MSTPKVTYLTNDLAEQIRRWRVARAFTQAELEGRAGLSHNAISRIENGVVTPRLDTVEKIAHALEISVEELQFRAPKGVEEPKADYGDAGPLLERLERLSAGKRRAVIDALVNLLDQMEPRNG